MVVCNSGLLHTVLLLTGLLRDGSCRGLSQPWVGSAGSGRALPAPATGCRASTCGSWRAGAGIELWAHRFAVVHTCERKWYYKATAAAARRPATAAPGRHGRCELLRHSACRHWEVRCCVALQYSHSVSRGRPDVRAPQHPSPQNPRTSRPDVRIRSTVGATVRPSARALDPAQSLTEGLHQPGRDELDP